MRWVVVLLLACACVVPQTVPCGELLCPAGNVCTPGGCASFEEAEVCANLDDGTPCATSAYELGACAGFACHPVVCGDGFQDLEERCDDGNTEAGDGCSRLCDSNETCGNDAIDAIRGEECDSGIVGLSGDGCTSTCKLEYASWRDATPSPIPGRGGLAMAYDEKRSTVVLFGGYNNVGVLGDTWEREVATWSRRPAPISPPARSAHMMVYDESRGLVVLFGGGGTNGLLADTWTWDGTSWVERHPSTSPPPRANAMLTYDSARGVAVLYGGYDGAAALDDTWEWNGTTWTPRGDVGAPPPLFNGGIAYDNLRSVVVLYGGQNLSTRPQETWEYDGIAWQQRAVTPPRSEFYGGMTFDRMSGFTILFGGYEGSTRLAETWQWDGTEWTSVDTPTSPRARSDTTLVFDQTNARVVMFGGYDFGTHSELLDDTWELDGADWHLGDTTAISPSARGYMPMVWDPVHGKIVLHGGWDAFSGALHSDLWEWSDRGWHLVSYRPPEPPARSDHALAYDTARARLVLFGGDTVDGDHHADTWEWDDTSWIQHTPATSPPKRTDHAMAYDPDRGVTILFGGRGRGADGLIVYGDTWSWDGVTWTEVTPPISPAARYTPALAFDPISKRVLLFGGRGAAYLADTWAWDGTAWEPIVTPIAPPGRSFHRMAYDAQRQRMILFGGIGDLLLGETWQWDGASWSVLATQQIAPLRSSHAMAYDAIRRELVVFGGASFTSDDLGDTWALRLDAPFQPIERCAVATEDADGDGLAGCADPDCWGRCTPSCPPGADCEASAPRCGDGTCAPALEDYHLCPADCS